MAYRKAQFDLSQGSAASRFPDQLGLKNVGFTVYILEPGEGFDYLHNHREQEEVYFCIEGTARIVVGGSGPGAELERIDIATGEAVKVEPETLRAIGNDSGERAVLVIAGGCPHPYPAGHGHDVIADVHKTVAHCETGFKRPSFVTHNPPDADENC